MLHAKACKRISLVLKDKNLIFAIFRKWKNELLDAAFICEDMK